MDEDGDVGGLDADVEARHEWCIDRAVAKEVEVDDETHLEVKQEELVGAEVVDKFDDSRAFDCRAACCFVPRPEKCVRYVRVK